MINHCLVISKLIDKGENILLKSKYMSKAIPFFSKNTKNT